MNFLLKIHDKNYDILIGFFNQNIFIKIYF